MSFMRFSALRPAFCGLVRKLSYNILRLNIFAYQVRLLIVLVND